MTRGDGKEGWLRAGPVAVLCGGAVDGAHARLVQERLEGRQGKAGRSGSRW